MEPWLRGPIPGVHPLLAPALYGFQQTREDLGLHTAGLTIDQVWGRPLNLTALGFHIRHIAGSVDRLTTYLEDRPLSVVQLAYLETEATPGAGLDELLAEVDRALTRAEEVIRGIHPESFAEPRWVGRNRAPSTVLGLAVHIAEHTQRHLGQAISAAKLARAAIQPR